MQKRICECENKLHVLGCLFNNLLSEEILSCIPNEQCNFVTIAEYENDNEIEMFDMSEDNSVSETDEDDEISSILDISDDDSFQLVLK